MEAVGEIVETGKSIIEFKVGDRVAYGTAKSGAYARYSVIDANQVAPVPIEISNETVVTCLTKGMMSHALMRRTFYVRPNMWILIHAAAGGVGHIMTALAKEYGAKVIATVSSEEKVKFLSKYNPDYIINYKKENFAKKVMEITKGKGVAAVYDSVGDDVFLDSLSILQNFGIMISYGRSSGAVENFSIDMLSSKSLFLASPILSNYKKDRKELILSALEVFGLAHSSIIPSIPDHIYKFEEIPLAHKKIENRETKGSQIVVL
jgi:NADPH2:quinone reductase